MFLAWNHLRVFCIYCVVDDCLTHLSELTLAKSLSRLLLSNKPQGKFVYNSYGQRNLLLNISFFSKKLQKGELEFC